MKGHIGIFLLGLGAATAAAFIYDKYHGGEISERVNDTTRDLAEELGRAKDHITDVATVATVAVVDLNQASPAEFERIGVVDPAMVDRIIEGRPYRNKLDLLARMIVPEDVYSVIRSHLDVGGANESVKVA